MTFAIILLFLLIARLLYVLSDRPASFNKTGFVLLIQLAPFVFFHTNWLIALLFLLLTGLSLLAIQLENHQPGKKELWRLTHLITSGVMAFAFTQFFSFSLAEWAIQVVGFFESNFAVADSKQIVSGIEMLIILNGLLLAVTEGHVVLRQVLNQVQIWPIPPESGMRDEEKFVIGFKSLRAGRLIGMLERMILFLVILKGQFGAAAFILAAKGIARFKELENRAFAEYVLIGTLLSAAVAMLIALATDFILKIT